MEVREVPQNGAEKGVKDGFQMIEKRGMAPPQYSNKERHPNRFPDAPYCFLFFSLSLESSQRVDFDILFALEPPEISQRFRRIGEGST